jgi:hypothetical protein
MTARVPIPVPWTLGVPGCGANLQTGPGGSFQGCPGRTTHVGVRLHRSPTRRRLELWLSFACAEHVDQLDAARELLDRDRAVQREWGEQRRRAQPGRPTIAPTPLATGADAKALHERALVWAAARRERPRRP